MTTAILIGLHLIASIVALVIGAMILFAFVEDQFFGMKLTRVRIVQAIVGALWCIFGGFGLAIFFRLVAG